MVIISKRMTKIQMSLLSTLIDKKSVCKNKSLLVSILKGYFFDDFNIIYMKI